MENNEVSKSNKIKIIVITALIFLVSIAGISYAYFTIQIVGNDTASSMRLRTANMSLVYNDVQIVSGEYAEPGWTQTKTLTVTNTGNVDADYIIKFRELVNTIINGELVISATCTASTGTCDNLPERAVHSASTEITDAYMYGPITIAPGVTHTYTVTSTFKETGSNQNYNQNKYFNGTLNIGDGTPTSEDCFVVQNYNQTTVRITDYTCQETNIIIPGTINNKTVTGIGSGSFRNKGITSAIIPTTVTVLDNNSFRGNQLTSITIPDTVTSLGQYAFCDNQLTSIVIPDSVTSMSDNVFQNNQLISALLSNNLTSIGNNVFNGNQLVLITIPSGVTTIGSSAFRNNQLISVVIPNSVTTIGSSAFYQNNISSLTLGSSVQTIGAEAFHENQLTSVVLPNSLVSIGAKAFRLNNFSSSLTIPSSVQELDQYAFGSGNALETVIIEGKSSSSQFSVYNSPFDWKSGLTCTTNNTSYDPNGCIIWMGSGS